MLKVLCDVRTHILLSFRDPVIWRTGAALPVRRPKSYACSGMHSRAYVWILGLILAANSLSVVATLRPADADLSPVLPLALTSTSPHPSTRDQLCTEPAALAPTLHLQRARQGKQTLELARSVSLIPSGQEHARPPQPVLAPTFSPWRFFYPRKLSPSPTEDDPPLS